MKRLICIILGLNLFSIVFAETNLFAEMPEPYYNFGKSYVSDFEHNLLYVNNEDRNSKLFYSMNTELRKTLSGEKTDKPNRKKGLFYASLSPAVLPGISVGYGWIESNSSSYIKENIIVLHINTIGFVHTAGILISINNFKNLYRKGFFTTVNLGCDYVATLGGVFLFPNLTAGGGYSFKISKNSFLHISLDFGIKLLISNIKLSLIINRR